MLDELLHRKLLRDGIEGEGVITGRTVEAAKGQLGVMGFYVAVEGRVTFDDGTAGGFSSHGLDTYKLGDLEVGTIVPVRYGADHKHVVLDLPRLEAAKAAKKQAAADLLARRRQEKIAAAEAELARSRKHPGRD